MFSRYIYKKGKKESGMLMLEATFLMTTVILLLVWILGLGFLYYQKYVTTVVVNDAVVKIASTYNNPQTDMVMGYTTTEDLCSRKLYRNFVKSKSGKELLENNKDRAASYIKYRLTQSNFSGALQDVEVNLELVKDSFVRKHLKLTAVCTYNTPVGVGLDFFGMGDKHRYEVVACADCTDYADYMSTTAFIAALYDFEGMGIVESASGYLNKKTASIVKMLEKLAGLFK